MGSHFHRSRNHGRGIDKATTKRMETCGRSKLYHLVFATIERRVCEVEVESEKVSALTEAGILGIPVHLLSWQ